MRLRTWLLAGSVSLSLLAVPGGATLASPQKPAPKPPKVKFTAAQAMKAALARYPGRVVGKIPLENEEGKWQYAVTIRSGKQMHEVMVDANTDRIASVEKVTAAEEAREEKPAAARAKGHAPKGGRPAHKATPEERGKGRKG